MISPSKRRSGFTLIEVTLACMLTAFLAVLLSTTWTLLMRPTADLIAWGQVFQEMDIAVASLARDLGGGQLDYDDGSGSLGEKRQGRLLACSGTFTDADGSHLQLCFDGGTSPNNTPDWATPDTVIDYYVDTTTDRLIRKNQKTSTSFTVAKNVDSMTLDNTDPDNIKVTLSFAFYFPHPADKDVDYWKKHLARTCVLIVKKNP